MNRPVDIVLCGLSGQGIVMASKIISTAALMEGQQVLATDVPAVKHRYTITLSHIRVGEAKRAPRVLDGEAEVVIAFEPMDALRVGIKYCREGGTIVYNTREIETRHITSKVRHQLEFAYPDANMIRAYIGRLGITDIYTVEGSDLALTQAGGVKYLNMIMVGAAMVTGKLPCTINSLEKAVQMLSPKGTADQNLKALYLGFQRVSASLVVAGGQFS